MNQIIESFITCIERKQRWNLTFYSQKEDKIITREIAPLDFWPKRIPKKSCVDYADNGADKFHYYDFDWCHPTCKDVNEVKKFEPIDDKFDPKKIVTRDIKCPWHVARSW